MTANPEVLAYLYTLSACELGTVAQLYLGAPANGDTPWTQDEVLRLLDRPLQPFKAEAISAIYTTTASRALTVMGEYMRRQLPPDPDEECSAGPHPDDVVELEQDERAAWREFACSVSRPPIDAAEAAGLDDAALRTSALQSLVNERNRADTVAGQEMSSAVAWRACAYDVLGMDTSTSISNDTLRTRVLEKFAALRTHNAQLQTPAGEGKKTKIREQAVEIDRLRMLLAAAPHVAALRIATGSTAPLVSGCRVAVIADTGALAGLTGVLLDVNMHGTASVLFDEAKYGGPTNVRVTQLRHESLVSALDKTPTPCDTEA